MGSGSARRRRRPAWAHGACRAKLKSGALVQLLKDWDMGAADVNAIFPAGRGAKLAARAFVEHFAKNLKTNP